MRKFLINILVFFGIISVIDVSFGRICIILRDKQKSQINSVIKSNFDVLIMGSSKAHQNYNPMILQDSMPEFSFYNAGYGGGSAIFSYALYNMIPASNRPKLVLFDAKQQFDIYEYNLDDEIYSRYFTRIKPYFNEKVVKDMYRELSLKEYVKMHSNLFRFNSSFVNLFMGGKNTNDSQNGFSPLNGLLTDDTPSSIDYIQTIDSYKLNYVIKLIESCKQNNVSVIVLLSPEYNLDYYEDFAPLRQICEHYDVPLWDYYRETDISNNINMFEDHCHMNAEGADCFTKIIAKRLKEEVMY